MAKTKVGITGQRGFIGSFLANYISHVENISFEVVEFKDSDFKRPDLLEKFVLSCDSIIHLAGMSRGDDDEIYRTNIELTHKLIEAIKESGAKPQILFASSIHEKFSSGFGRSKKESRELLVKWSKKNDSRFVGLIIPHVFGPFGKPYHNSAFATFCHELASGKKPKITNDSEVQLIYVEELAKVIIGLIASKADSNKLVVQPERKLKISKVLEILTGYQRQYLKAGIFPELNDSFEINMFNTFRSYLDAKKQNFKLIKHEDGRGYFCEAVKFKTSGGQLSYSFSKKGIVRGNHFHTRKIERFCVIDGRARINLRRVGDKKITTYEVSGDKPEVIDIPIWYAHNIENIAKKPLLTLFFTNEIYDSKDSDTYSENV